MTSPMKVDPAALNQAAGELKGAAAELDSILDTLAKRLDGMDWEGSDRASYEEYRAQWHQAVVGLNDVLTQIGATVGKASEEYVNTERFNAKLFQG